MLLSVFTWLTHSLSGSPAAALTAAFIWGIFSMILSPCHLSSIPLVIGFLSGRQNLNVKKTFVYTLLFASGILISIVAIGLITGLLGRILGDIGVIGNLIMAFVFFIIGLFLMGVVPLPFLNGINRPQFQKKGYFAALVLGIIFGIAVGPCTFAYMAPLLGMVFKTASFDFYFAAFLILLYAAGHCLIIIISGLSFELVEKLLQFHEKSRAVKILKIFCGLLVILGGVYLLTDSMKLLGIL